MSNFVAKESPTSFAPEALSHREYYPNFGYYTLQISATPKSQLMSSKTYLLSLSDPQISIPHTLYPVDPFTHISPLPALLYPINWSSLPFLAFCQLSSALITTFCFHPLLALGFRRC